MIALADERRASQAQLTKDRLLLENTCAPVEAKEGEPTYKVGKTFSDQRAAQKAAFDGETAAVGSKKTVQQQRVQDHKTAGPQRADVLVERKERLEYEYPRGVTNIMDDSKAVCPCLAECCICQMSAFGKRVNGNLDFNGCMRELQNSTMLEYLNLRSEI